MTKEVKPAKQKHVIWDTDGSPDSVIALCYFLMHPEISVDGIVVSCGEARPEIYIVKLMRMFTRLGRIGIPMAAGRSTPLEGNNAFPDPWRELINEFFYIDLPELEGPLPEHTAAELMVQILREAREPVTVYLCGSHTNLAEALRLDPGIKEKIQSVHVMGGAVYAPGNIESEWPAIKNKFAEWNIWVDPVAASEVFAAGIPLYLTPLDATSQVKWTDGDADAWEAGGTAESKLALEIMRRMLDYWREIYSGGVYLWDLVTAVHLTNPELCETESLYLEVVTERGEEQGRTAVRPGKPANTTVFLKPQADAIRQQVARVLGRERE